MPDMSPDELSSLLGSSSSEVAAGPEESVEEISDAESMAAEEVFAAIQQGDKRGLVMGIRDLVRLARE